VLVIRKEQLFAFQADADRRFHGWVMDHVRAGLPKVADPLSPEQLSRMVRFAVAKAEGYGLKDESNILTFVTLMFAVAPNFDRYLWFAMQLADPRLPPDLRFETLLLDAAPEDWDEAAELNDNDWGVDTAKTVGA